MKQYTLKSYPGSKEADIELKKKFPQWKFYGGLFEAPADYRGSEKVRIYAKYWRGEWTGFTTEKYGTMYRQSN